MAKTKRLSKKEAMRALDKQKKQEDSDFLKKVIAIYDGSYPFDCETTPADLRELSQWLLEVANWFELLNKAKSNDT